ncbi:MAG: hypothetical protein KQ78_02124 [Candidatus Izimaplasma bacterium HR2]|nr:MAG: hypothetical protein KQ78_02124 [Candidatus Izimaplasma bacterium HR2]
MGDKNEKYILYLAEYKSFVKTILNISTGSAAVFTILYEELLDFGFAYLFAILFLLTSALFGILILHYIVERKLYEYKHNTVVDSTPKTPSTKERIAYISQSVFFFLAYFILLVKWCTFFF